MWESRSSPLFTKARQLCCRAFFRKKRRRPGCEASCFASESMPRGSAPIIPRGSAFRICKRQIHGSRRRAGARVRGGIYGVIFLGGDYGLGYFLYEIQTWIMEFIIKDSNHRLWPLCCKSTNLLLKKQISQNIYDWEAGTYNELFTLILSISHIPHKHKVYIATCRYRDWEGGSFFICYPKWELS